MQLLRTSGWHIIVKPSSESDIEAVSHALVAAGAGPAAATPCLTPALGGVPGLLPAPDTANFCFFSAGFSICVQQQL